MKKYLCLFSQIVSVYAEPDTMELNYHAGTACRSVAQLVVTEHIGVRFHSAETADAITAALVISVCLNSGVNLSKVDMNIQTALQYLKQFFAMTTVTTIPMCTEQNEFSPSRFDKIDLYCFCLTAWIDGSTSKSIYGEQQKQFKVYQCSNCNNWFHKECLTKLSIPIPTRKETFVCSKCTVPATVPWNHQIFTNTCTSDNFLTILMLYCQQHPNFLSHLGSSDVEVTLKATISLMNKSNITEGKSLMLQKAHERLNFSRDKSGKYNCYGTEESAFLCLFAPIWKLHLLYQCTSDFCPTKKCIRTRFQTTFSLPENSSSTPLSAFPQVEDITGYCGAEFSSKPPSDVPCKLTDTTDISNAKRSQFYACSGSCKIVGCRFTHNNPWVIPISIESITFKSIKNLPLTMTVYMRRYQLGGCTFNTGGHFVAVLLWHGKPYFYDGIKSTKQQRFVEYTPHLLTNLANCNGSYAYYFLSSNT